MKKVALLIIIFMVYSHHLMANTNENYQSRAGAVWQPSGPQAQVSVNATGLFPFRGLLGFGGRFLRIWTVPQAYDLQKYNVSLASTYFFPVAGLGITLEMGGGQSFQQVEIEFLSDNNIVTARKRATTKRATFDMMLLLHYGRILHKNIGFTTEFGWFYSYGMNAQITGLTNTEQENVRSQSDFLDNKHNHGPAVKVGMEFGQMLGGFYMPIGYMIRYNFSNGWLHGFYLGLGYKIG